MKFISFIFILLFFSAGVVAKPTVELRTPPQVKHGQYVKELLNLAYDEIGYEIVHIPVPGVREIPMATRSQIDGVLARDQIIELSNPRLVKVEVPLFSYELILLVNSKLCGECNENELTSIAYPRGGKIYEQYINKLPDAVQRVGINGIQSMLQMLEKGRVDSVAVADISIPEQRIFDENIKIKRIEVRYDFHYLSPNNSHLKLALEQTLNSFVKDGTLEKLKVKYGIEERSE